MLPTGVFCYAPDMPNSVSNFQTGGRSQCLCRTISAWIGR